MHTQFQFGHYAKFLQKWCTLFMHAYIDTSSAIHVAQIDRKIVGTRI